MTLGGKESKDLVPGRNKAKKTRPSDGGTDDYFMKEKNAEMYGKEVTLLVDETEGDTIISFAIRTARKLRHELLCKGSDAEPGRLHSRPYHGRPSYTTLRQTQSDSVMFNGFCAYLPDENQIQLFKGT